MDLAHVRVHADAESAAVSRSLQASAFTHGSDLYFGQGSYDPGSTAGQRLIAHELAHVAQQATGSAAGATTVVGRADDPAEVQADRFANSVVLRKLTRLPTTVQPTRPEEQKQQRPAAPARMDLLRQRSVQRQTRAFTDRGAAGAGLDRLRRMNTTGAGEGGHLRREIDPQVLVGFARSDDPAGAIATATDAYNQGLANKDLKVKLTELSKVEHAVYAWFSSQKMPNFEASPTALRLKELLTAIQKENEDLVQSTLNGPAADPPVANFDDLSVPDKAKVRKIWSDLVAGSGNIAITETQTYESTGDNGGSKEVQHAGFKVQVLTSFARLLTADFGRQLVGEINSGDKLVTVRPGYAKARDDVPAEELVANADSPEGATLKEFTAVEYFGKLQKGTDGWNAAELRLEELYPLSDLDPFQSEAARMDFMHHLGPVQAKPGVMTEGISIMAGNSRRYFRFGAGSQSTITYTSDLRDGSADAMSRFVDDEGNEIIVPVFIALGHELGHALHSLHGASPGEARELEPIAGAGIDLGKYSGTLEEAVTIRGVENPLRAEHGITTRHSHHNVISLASEEIKVSLNKAFAAADKLPMKVRRPVEEMLVHVNSLMRSDASRRPNRRWCTR